MSLQTVLRTALVTALLPALAATGAHAQTRLLIISGLGGDPKYTREFAQLATTLATAAVERGGMPDSTVLWFGENTAPRSKWFRAASTRANIEPVVARFAQLPATHPVVIVLIGHGSGEGADTRISLPGPDFSAADFARMLDALGDRPVAFINMSSGSGDMLAVLAKPGRVVMTATRSAFERNESQFARFFVAALADDGADTDKDDRVSLLEAYTFADAETKRFYEDQQLLATEHPQLADDGGLARRFWLTAGAAGSASSDPRVIALYQERQKLEAAVAALRARKDQMSAEAYDAELERLLLDLAEKTAELRRLEKPGGER